MSVTSFLRGRLVAGCGARCEAPAPVVHAREHPPKEHYSRRRAAGDRHAAALRHLFNRMIGQLLFCLQTRQLYDQDKAFSIVSAPGPTLPPAPASTAA
jgi:hypothetical protein